MPGIFLLQPAQAVLQDADGNALAVKDGVTIPANTPGLLTLVSDGTASRFLKGDTSGRLVVVGAGVAGTPAGGVLTVQGIAGGTPVPVSGSFSFTDPAEGAPGSAAPVQALQIGGTDGTNLRAGVVINTAPTTQYGLVTRPIQAQLPTSLVGGRLDVNLGAWLGSTTPTVGQKAMAASIPVTLASDQTAITVTMTPATAATAGFVMGDIQTAVLGTYAIRRGTYNEQSVNAQRSIASSSANDTAAGTGARTVTITYYTATFTGPFTVTLTLNGTTAVNTVATDICYIEDIAVVTVGGTGSNVGVLTLYVGTGGAGGTLATVTATSNQAHFCHHYVPTGQTAHITAQWAGHTGTTVGSGATFVIRAKVLGVANAVEHQVSDTFRLYGQSSSVQRNYGTPIRVPGPARIVTYVIPETATNVNYRASFDFYED